MAGRTLALPFLTARVFAENRGNPETFSTMVHVMMISHQMRHGRQDYHATNHAGCAERRQRTHYLQRTLSGCSWQFIEQRNIHQATFLNTIALLLSAQKRGRPDTTPPKDAGQARSRVHSTAAPG
jgi:hypothetical protein